MNKETILLQGIETLCNNDNEINTLIAHNKEKIIDLLTRYINEIELFNPAYGLVGASDTEELIIKHILDSLAPLGILSRLLSSLPCALCAPVSPCESPSSLPCASRTFGSMPPCDPFFQYYAADAGSGAGLPGIPLAVTMPHCGFSLIERMGRRAGFLHNTKAALSLSNINVEESEIEKAAGGRFDLVTFRAFKPLEPKIFKSLFKLCAPQGIIAAYKGKMEKIEAEMATLADNTKWEAIPYNVPFLEEERHILVIRI